MIGSEGQEAYNFTANSIQGQEAKRTMVKFKSKQKFGKSNPFYGKKHTEETKNKISVAMKNHKQSEETIQKRIPKISGVNHYNWKGGISLQKYNSKFHSIKKEIKKRDDYFCAVCMKQCKVLDCHHIDYNKENNNQKNLISLCKVCHTKTNFDRTYWREIFNERINTDIWVGVRLGCPSI